MGPLPARPWAPRDASSGRLCGCDRAPVAFPPASPNRLPRRLPGLLVTADRRPLAGPPDGAVAVPDPVVAAAAGGRLEAVWVNELGGVTWRVSGAGRYVKWAPAGSGLDLLVEAERMVWAGRFTPVPAVLDAGTDGDGSWLVTSAVDASSAASAAWRAKPATAVAAVGAGLRALHDALPVDDCPWSWSIESRVAAAAQRGATRPPETSAEEAEGALAAFGAPPEVDRLVVCHGDACCPNTLLDSSGRYIAHVDLAALGVADRWADLAVATYSTVWNYGPGWEGPLLDAYGIDPDPERTRYYRQLWDLA